MDIFFVLLIAFTVILAVCVILYFMVYRKKANSEMVKTHSLIDRYVYMNLGTKALQEFKRLLLALLPECEEKASATIEYEIATIDMVLRYRGALHEEI